MAFERHGDFRAEFAEFNKVAQVVSGLHLSAIMLCIAGGNTETRNEMNNIAVNTLREWESPRKFV